MAAAAGGPNQAGAAEYLQRQQQAAQLQQLQQAQQLQQQHLQHLRNQQVTPCALDTGLCAVVCALSRTLVMALTQL